MITLYTDKKIAYNIPIIKWLKENNLEYRVRKIDYAPLTKSEINALFVRTENGLEDIVTWRSKVFKNVPFESLEEMSYSEMLDFVFKNQRCLRRPILFNEKYMVIGYQTHDFYKFIPRNKRNLAVDLSED